MTAVLIVEDIAETRRWLEGIVSEAFEGTTSVCSVGSVRDALAAVQRSEFDVALLDLGLPDGSGVDVLRHIRQIAPATLCVVTTVMADDANIVGALSAGANGYLLKEQRRELIIRQLSQLFEGIPALSPSIALRIMQHFQFTGPVGDDTVKLTEREQEVLGLISRGLRNADVAESLEISAGTVAHHIKSIYRKLDISSRAEATWHATRLGLNTQYKK